MSSASEAGNSAISRRIHAVVACVLFAGGALNLHALATGTQEDDARMLLGALFSEAEIFAGIWLAWGRDPVQARPWAISIFAGFWASSFYCALAGKCSCGRFGVVSVGPWMTMALDLAILGILLKWHPPRDDRSDSAVSAPSVASLALVALIVAAVSALRPPLVSASGVATWRDRPLADASLTFRRYSVQVEVRTDDRGQFRLPPIRAGRYTVSAPADLIASESKSGLPAGKIEEDARKLRKRSPGKTASNKARGPKSSGRREVVADKSVEIGDCERNSLKVDF